VGSSQARTVPALSRCKSARNVAQTMLTRTPAPETKRAGLRPEVNEQALTAAWLRVRALASADGLPDIEEMRRLELTLRPVAGSPEIQQVVVPLLDRLELRGLAMAWDSDPNPPGREWHLARFERWLKLGAPEFAFIALAQLGGGEALDEEKQRAHRMLEAEREPRAALFAQNLNALGAVDPDLSQRLAKHPRLTVGLRPLGAGVAEFSSHGGSHLQLWAATPEDALAEAEELVGRCRPHGECFIAGVGDGTLPAVAMHTTSVNPREPLIAHVVEPNLARIRALFEVVDVSAALREGRIWLHAGAHGIETLARVFARGRPLAQEAVIGGDPVAISMMEAAASAR
jgi:hypothetical protein